MNDAENLNTKVMCCAKGHWFDDEELVYCPECGLPLKSIERKEIKTEDFYSQDSTNTDQNRIAFQQSSKESVHIQEIVSIDPGKKDNRKVKRWVAAFIAVFIITIVVLEATDTTKLIPALHQEPVQLDMEDTNPDAIQQNSSNANGIISIDSRFTAVNNLQLLENSDEIFDIAQEGMSWTEETAPQTINSFPFFPFALFDILDKLEKVTFHVSHSSDEYVIETNISQLVDDTWTLEINWHDKDTVYQYSLELVQFRKDGSSLYFTCPEEHRNNELELSWQKTIENSRGHYLEIILRYHMVNGKLIPSVDIWLGKSGFSILYSADKRDQQNANTMALVYLNQSFTRGLYYDMNGKLREVY